MRILAFVPCALLLAGCPVQGTNPNNDFAKPADLSMSGGPDLSMIFSCCGQPSDKGNSKGVGAFCDDQTNCPGPQAIFCASLGGDPNQHFCTLPCTAPADGGMDPCGEMASCQCSGGQCGCYPDVCAMRGTPDGCM